MIINNSLPQLCLDLIGVRYIYIVYRGSSMINGEVSVDNTHAWTSTQFLMSTKSFGASFPAINNDVWSSPHLWTFGNSHSAEGVFCRCVNKTVTVAVGNVTYQSVVDKGHLAKAIVGLRGFKNGSWPLYHTIRTMCACVRLKKRKSDSLFALPSNTSHYCCSTGAHHETAFSH